jgi:TRAP-type C4-dicarboxylate transport system permease large subunit
MADQTIAKPLGLIKDLKILIHGIPYVVIFTVIQSSVIDSNYSMLLGCLWQRDVKMSHD